MQQFIDNWRDTLTAPALAADEHIHISPALSARLTGLGAGNFYALTLARVAEAGGTLREVAWENVHVTAVAAGVLTVQRGQEGTTPLDWSVGELISARLTAASAERLRGEPAFQIANRFNELQTEQEKTEARANLGLQNIDGGTFN